MAASVGSTSVTTEDLSREELLKWVNGSLNMNLTKIAQLCDGTVYCKFLHELYDTKLDIEKVKQNSTLELDYIANFKLVQQCFKKVNVDKDVPVEGLVKGRLEDNLEFIQWFKKFFDAKKEDDAEYRPVTVCEDASAATGMANKEPAVKSVPSSTGKRAFAKPPLRRQEAVATGLVAEEPEHSPNFSPEHGAAGIARKAKPTLRRQGAVETGSVAEEPEHFLSCAPEHGAAAMARKAKPPLRRQDAVDTGSVAEESEHTPSFSPEHGAAAMARKAKPPLRRQEAVATGSVSEEPEHPPSFSPEHGSAAMGREGEQRARRYLSGAGTALNFISWLLWVVLSEFFPFRN